MTVVDKVRQSCLQLATTSLRVKINKEAIPPLALSIAKQATTAPILWDEEHWHYRPANGLVDGRERLAMYILALDSINFCFWPCETYEYQDLAETLTSLAESTSDNDNVDYPLSPTRLSVMTMDEMKSLFVQHHKKGQVPTDMEDRCKLWNEVGRVLLDRFDGSALKLIESSNGSAAHLVDLLVDNFTGFQDYQGDSYFLKRAQICVGDWNASLDLQLSDIDKLTMFADYRVPQLLRHFGILEYSESLAKLVDTKQELAVASEEEQSIRAATVTAVEWIVDELKNKHPNKTWTAVETDWYLWQVAERMDGKGELQPFHRVRTIYY
jgi:hypothetical protein